jgi:hypothetical protein
MKIRHAFAHRAGHLPLVLFASMMMANPALAADGRIAFTGAIVAPTCSMDTASVQQISKIPSHTVQASCATSQDKPRDGSSYQLKVTSMNGAQVDPRVQTYFQQFSHDHSTLVAVRTYH